MFDKIKFNLAHYIIRKKYLSPKKVPLSFNGVITNSNSFFVIMPNDPIEFTRSVELINYLIENRKRISVFLNKNLTPSLSDKSNIEMLTYEEESINKLGLPNRTMVNLLKNKEYDIVLDLNRTGAAFLSSVANIVKSKVKVGFVHEKTENYYDLQIANTKLNPEETYRNYINFLRMF